MIAKRIPRTKGTSSAARLVRYMVAAQGGIEPESWKRTADYILDTKKTTTQGEKVASYRVTNCDTDDPAQATVEIETTQLMNQRSKADKTYHLVFSFPPGEQPPLEVLHAIEDELCEAIGLADHQRISAVHQDTDHLHVHVAINKVHPTGLQNIEPFYDMPRLMEACERLEIKHGLTRTNHGLTEGKAYDLPKRIRLDPDRGHDSRFREFLRQSYYLKIAEQPEAETYNGLRKLPGSGVAHNQGRYSELLPGNARHRLQPGRTEQPNGVRRTGDGAGRDGGGRPNVSGLPGDMEAHAGVESLAGYVAREVAPAMRQAATWQELHAALAEHGLQMKQRGAGLVIGDAGLKLWCKASDAGRDLSAKALTDRLGPFERDENQPRPARRRYTPGPRQTHPASAALFAQYQRERQAAIGGRRHSLAAIRSDTAQQRETLRKWASAQRTIAKVGMRGPARKMFNAALRTQVAAKRAAIAKEAAAKRAGLSGGASLTTWNDWLAARAQGGDVDALAVLRGRAERAEKMRGDLLTAKNAEQAKTVILDSLKAVARKDGAMSYRTADGGLVVDRTTHVQAQQATTGAAFVALTLAAERFESQALDVRGSEQFRRDVAQLAGVHGIAATFADPELEAIRQKAASERAASRPQSAPEAPKGAAPRERPPERPSGPQKGREGAAEGAATPAVLAWIDKRNSARSKISSIDYNRLWTDKDAGRATYQGRRRMEDGTEVLLLKRGDEMLVKPSTANVVAKASRWRVGKQVTVNARGRFIDTSKGQEL